jgi:NhaP-type Na+/H+ or K+/H+ antiporter
VVQVALAIMQRLLDATAYQRVAEVALGGGVLIGLAVAAFIGWRNSRALDNLWQNGVIGVLSAVGALLVGFLAAPIDHFLGPFALFVWFALAVSLGVVSRRWALRGRGTESVVP